MDALAEDLKTVVARDRIRDCIIRLARGEDRRDAELIGASCWPDSTSDYGVFRGNFAEYLAWVVPGSPALPVTQHMLGQSFIELEGDVARAETQVISYHRVDMGEEHRDVFVAGRYLDRLEARGGKWRIAERTMIYDWSQDIGRSIDWSQGLMGMPLGGEHFSGRAQGDYSEIFFGKRLAGQAGGNSNGR
jgi:hypothetical protein